jgi:hypothetical protein
MYLSPDDAGRASDMPLTDTVSAQWLARIEATCRSCVRELPVDGAAVVLTDGDSNDVLLHATDQIITRLIDREFVIGEGPQHDVLRTGQISREPHLAGTAAQRRWPGFAQEAVTAGAGAAFGFPLRIGPAIVGVLTLYRRRPGDLPAAHVTTVGNLANTGLGNILHDLPDPGPFTEHGFRLGREEIPQATGMIAVQRQTTLREALVLLRAAAYTQNRPITELATDIITRRVTFTHPD